MKKIILALSLLLPLQALSVEDSVYSWGSWSQGIKPAAGPSVTATPSAVQAPNVNFRPNENSAFSRSPTALAINTANDNAQVPTIQIRPPGLPIAPPPPPPK